MSSRWIFALALVIAATLLAGCTDDPFYPRAPDYTFTVQVTGLENFTASNGSAVIMVPLPAVYGEPVLKDGWWPDEHFPEGQVRHGTSYVRPVNTTYGPMLAIDIDMTDYYVSYARVTPVAVSPGQNMSEAPVIVPDRINKSLSFDDVRVIAGGSIERLDFKSSPEGRREVGKFLGSPLLPMADDTSYVYIDENLKPLHNASTIHIVLTLKVRLNHNKMNISEEGARRFETHTYAIDETIPAGRTGFIPVAIRRSSYSGIYN
jgi:hypothetical protein